MAYTTVTFCSVAGLLVEPPRTAGTPRQEGVQMSQLTVRESTAAITTLAITVGLLLLGAGPALADGNDYPYAAQTNTSTWDPWRFTERQCTSFVAWRSHQRGYDMSDTTTTPWGDAGHWDSEAATLGVAVNSTPTVGSFAQWDAGEQRTWTSGTSTYWFTASAHGHIAYVAAVYTDGTVLLQDYNGFGGDRVYGTKRLPASGVPRYLHYAG